MQSDDALTFWAIEGRKRWLVTGAAGFIGSHLVEALLRLDQDVIGLDNFSTGHRRNLDDIERQAGDRMRNLEFIEGDIRDLEACRRACAGADYVLHQAALGSVPRSLEDPITTDAVNIGGFLNMLVASRDEGVERFVYAASSSTYGDHPGLPKVEDRIGRPLSPYAVTKLTNELYAEVFSGVSDLAVVGLRYFNIFGPRQDPDGAYAAVIPRWISNVLANAPCVINGDGESSRDFCYVANAVQANLRTALAPRESVRGEVFNVACGEQTSLNQLFHLIREGVSRHSGNVNTIEPLYADFRPGDVRHSLADISKIEERVGYQVTHPLHAGLLETIDWFARRCHQSIAR